MSIDLYRYTLGDEQTDTRFSFMFYQVIYSNLILRNLSVISANHRPPFPTEFQSLLDWLIDCEREKRGVLKWLIDCEIEKKGRSKIERGNRLEKPKERKSSHWKFACYFINLPWSFLFWWPELRLDQGETNADLYNVAVFSWVQIRRCKSNSTSASLLCICVAY